jgi:hypothetical protein
MSNSRDDFVPQPPLRRQTLPTFLPSQPRRASATSNRPLSAVRDDPPTTATEPDHDALIAQQPKADTLHHLPIALALLPAAAGVLVGGGDEWTDVMLLVLAGIYLNWLVKC